MVRKKKEPNRVDEMLIDQSHSTSIESASGSAPPFVTQCDRFSIYGVVNDLYCMPRVTKLFARWLYPKLRT
jgi:hypothetical protein